MSGEGPSKKKKQQHMNELQLPLTMPGLTLNTVNQQLFPRMAEKIKSSDSTYWLPTTVWLCGFILGDELSIQKVLETMLVPTLIRFLSVTNFPELQVEAAKALRYLASGTSEVAKPTNDQDMNPLHDTLKRLLYSENDMVLSHACCSLALLSGCKDVKFRRLVRESGLYQRLLELTRNPTLNFVALRALGNVMLGDANLITLIVKQGFLHDLKRFLTQGDVNVGREACWIITYIAAEKRCFSTQAMIDADLITPLVAAVTDGEFVVMEAAVWAISNATFGATSEHIKHMVSRGCIDVLCNLVCCRDLGIFEVCLDGLTNILKAGEKEKIKNRNRVNPYVERMKEIEAWRVLEVASRFYQKKLLDKGLKLMLKYEALSESRYKHYMTSRRGYCVFGEAFV